MLEIAFERRVFGGPPVSRPRGPRLAPRAAARGSDLNPSEFHPRSRGAPSRNSVLSLRDFLSTTSRVTCNDVNYHLVKETLLSSTRNVLSRANGLSSSEVCDRDMPKVCAESPCHLSSRCDLACAHARVPAILPADVTRSRDYIVRADVRYRDA